MAKKIDLAPNERIDLADFLAGTQNFTSEELKLYNERFVLDNFARILDGFAVQVVAPSTITIYNGVGLDRSGQRVLNEQDLFTSRSATPGVDATYFIEIQFIETASDSDARGIFDTTFDNGTDPSGDPRPEGREAETNIATRLTDDWTIVSPISTTGFEITTNPNSTKIPIAVVTRAGGVISGATLVVNKTILAKDVAGGISSVKVLDSRTFPDTFTATIGAEAVSITINDRENGILTLAAGLGGGHTSGERVIQTGGGIPQFLTPRTVQSVDAISGTSDQRPRLLQANEEKGYVLSQDPYSNTGRADIGLRTNKELLDFTAAQIREIKFGALRNTDLGKTAPPSVFSAAPRYFDASGGLLGAKSCTVSVGDGVTTWGDFNVTQEGSARAAIQAAHDALPSAGGIIFIKNKVTPYDITGSALAFSKTCKLVGESRIVEIRGNGAVAAINISGAGNYIFQDISITRNAGSTSTAALTSTLNGTIELHFNNCIVHGVSLDANTDTSGSGKNSFFFTTSVTGSNEIAFQGLWHGGLFEQCYFGCGNTLAAARSLVLYTGSTAVTFNKCQFLGDATATNLIQTGNSSQRIAFNNCTYSGAASFANILSTGSSMISFRNCYALCDNGFIQADNVTDLYVNSCHIEVLAQITAILIGNTTSVTGVHIADCEFKQTTAPGGTTAKGVYLRRAKNASILNCTFTNFDTMIELGEDVQRFNIRDCTLDCPTGARGAFGIRSTGTSALANGTIESCIFNILSRTDVAVSGISLNGTNVILNISKCKFISLGAPSNASSSYGIYAENLNGTTISECVFSTISSSVSNAGIFVNTSAVTSKIINNYFINIGGTLAGNSYGININTTPQYLDICHNNFNGVFSTDPAKSCYGIIITGSTVSAVDNQVNICNNYINHIGNTGSTPGGVGILVNNTGYQMAIDNNIILFDATGSTGIQVIGTNAGALIEDITINNNKISPTRAATVFFDVGIQVLAGAAANQRFTITGNQVREHRGVYGIGVNAVAGNGLNLANNMVSTSIATATTGIYCISGLDFTINNNNVILSDNTNTHIKTGIACLSSNRGAIVGNKVFLANTAVNGWNIDLTGTTRIVVSGNLCSMTTAHNQAILTDQGTTVYIVSNVITGSSGASIPISYISTGSVRALSIVASNNAVTPGSLADVGLNYMN